MQTTKLDFMAQAAEAADLPSPQTRARVAWIFCSKRAIGSRLAASSASMW